MFRLSVLVLAVAALLQAPAALGRVNYFKGLTSVADLKSLQLLDDEGRFRKHTLVSFTLPDEDDTAACALDQLQALHFPHLFFHLSGEVFEMIQVFVDSATELTQAFLPDTAGHKDACRSFLFIPQNATVASAGGKGAAAEGRRLVKAQSQQQVEEWFWGLQCGATGPFAFRNDQTKLLMLYREKPSPRPIEVVRVNGPHGALGGLGGIKEGKVLEEHLVNLKPGERVVFTNASMSLCRGHTVLVKRWGGRHVARLVLSDENFLPKGSTLQSAVNLTDADAIEEEEEKGRGGVTTVMGMKARVNAKVPVWDPRRLQMTEELADLYRTRMDYNIKRLQRVEHSPRRAAALWKDAYRKERVPEAMWSALQSVYKTGLEERRFKAELEPARGLRVESARVPLPTVVQANRNSNPPPVSVRFWPADDIGRARNITRQELTPRVRAWTGRNDMEFFELQAFRRYFKGSFLRDHCDGASEDAIDILINMGQDDEATEPWEFHILDSRGQRHRVTMEPGDMLMYLRSRQAHGRPMPLTGKFYDDIFARMKIPGLEDRPVSSGEAALGPLVVHELPGSGLASAQVGGEDEGFTAEL